MIAFRLFLAGVFLVLTATAQDSPYVKEDGRWWRVERGERFLVSSEEMTARFVDGIENLADFRNQLDDGGALFEGLKVVRSNMLGVVDFSLPEGADPVEIVLAMRATGLVDFAEVGVYGRYVGVPNDPQFSTQWNLRNIGQSGGTSDADVDADEAWDITGGDPSIVVAVIDSGTEYFHPDLAANIWNNSGEIPNNGVDDDGNGFIDDTIGWDFEDDDNSPNTNFFHGTAVAGVVAAVGNNGTGIAGLAGGGDAGGGCSVMPLCAGEFFPISTVVDDAVLYAANNGARVITLSLSVPSDTAIINALSFAHDTANVFIDCSAGNSGGPSISFPATHDDVMAVASTDRNDKRSSFSSTGTDLEVSAPGEDILMLDLNGNYGGSSGTSFSSPHVAALAGLLFSVNPALSNDQVRQLIIDGVDDVEAPGYDTDTGHGRINAATSLALATGSILGTTEIYGKGLPGTPGEPLVSSTGGAPSVGNAIFRILMKNALPSAPYMFVIGFSRAALPFKGGKLLVDPTGWITLFGTTTTTGRAAIPIPIPPDPALEGLIFDSQWIVADPGAIQGMALSAGFEVTIGT